MTTLNDLRQRLENTALEPLIEETPMAPLAASVTSTATAFSIEAGVFSPDEENHIGPGRLLELDNELVRVVEYNSLLGSVTCVRGRRGSTAAAHVAGTDVRIPTRWPRVVILRALQDAIDSLWKPLFVVEEQRATIDTAGYVALPLDTVRVLEVQYEVGDGTWADADAKLFSTHPLDETSAAIQLEPLARSSGMCVVRYGRKLVSPDTANEEIALLPTKWERIILADAAAQLLSSVDIDATTQEYLTEQLRLERFPVRSGASISESLIRYRNYLVEQARAEVEAQYPVGIRMMPVIYVR